MGLARFLTAVAAVAVLIVGAWAATTVTAFVASMPQYCPGSYCTASW
jgi:hypothetical protein